MRKRTAKAAPGARDPVAEISLLRDPRKYAENLLFIRNKDSKLQKLIFNDAQQNLYRIIQEKHHCGDPTRLIVLKGRQEGISTLVEGLMFQDSATRSNVKTLIVAHESQATANLFKMNKLFFDYLPTWAQPMRKNSNAKELVFENPTKDEAEKRARPGLRSSIRCQTAGSGGVGRSDTLTNVHLSEFAFWPESNKEELLLGIMQAVPDSPDTMVVIESTANGYDYFKKLWDGAEAGTNGWTPVFLPWYLEPGYRRSVPPGTIWTDEEKQLQAQYSLDEEQLQWRRWCIKTNCGGSEAMFRQEYPCNPDEAFLLSGDGYFNNTQLQEMRRRAVPPVREGEFLWKEPATEYGAPLQWAFNDRKGGMIRVWKEPEKGAPYVIGGDTAGEGSDCFTAYVIDNRTGEQVAELQYPFSELLYARQLYCLGMWYNQALLGVEVNFSTYPVAKLEEWNYPNLYQRERVDTYTGALAKAYGWQTSGKTRPLALAGLHTVMEETPELIRSWRLMGEMLTFVYDKNRRPAASPGQHDDLVMAAAICYAIRGQQRAGSESEETDRKWWTKDMWEDWRRADDATRRQLEETWKRRRRRSS